MPAAGARPEQKEVDPVAEYPSDSGRERQASAETTQPKTGGRRSLDEEAEAPPTEKPVPAQGRVVQYVFSVDEGTGFVVRIEKVDAKSGKKRELTQDEYAAAYAFASYAAPYYAGYAASLYDPLSDPAIQAYLKAVADYLKQFVH